MPRDFSPQPSKIVALWNNYYELSKKLGHDIPSEPLYFLKTQSSFSGHEDRVECPPTSQYGRTYFEGELGIVLKKRCTKISLDQAQEHIEGFTCINDLTVPALLTRDNSFAQWTRAKNFDGFGAFGPTIASGLKHTDLSVLTYVDGKLMQNYPCQDMIFSPQQLVYLISQDLTLEAGDIIACGTSIGSRPLREGSVVEVHIEGIGTLRTYFGSKQSEGS
jgi:2-keto-4-pentenoate hydratase/2-oxohepta-3-ene-1,7-dioic acid hydratase in catechol pathway